MPALAEVLCCWVSWREDSREIRRAGCWDDSFALLHSCRCWASAGHSRCLAVVYWVGCQYTGFPVAQSVKKSACNAGDCLWCQRLRFNPWVRKIPWRRKWQPTQYSCLGNPVDRGAWWTTVHGVTRVGRDLATNPPPPPGVYELPLWLSGKESASQGRRHGFEPWVGKIPLEKEMAIHSNIFAWRAPWIEDPGWGHKRVGHDLATTIPWRPTTGNLERSGEGKRCWWPPFIERLLYAWAYTQCYTCTV